MTDEFTSKHAAREAVWERMKTERVAAFPFPIRGRIPNFKGARDAARLLFTVEPWKGATRIKVNPDSPQRPVREEALRRRIAVFVPTPRLKGGFRMLDPDQIPQDAIAEAATIPGAERWGREIPLDALPQMDAIVCGSVAVTRMGFRCGKGEGYSDIEFAILRELGHRPVPVATTVHALQWVNELPQEPTDQPLSLIVTPESVFAIDDPHPAPAGIDWDRVTPKDLEDMPVLQDLASSLTGDRKRPPPTLKPATP